MTKNRYQMFSNQSNT